MINWQTFNFLLGKLVFQIGSIILWLQNNKYSTIINRKKNIDQRNRNRKFGINYKFIDIYFIFIIKINTKHQLKGDVP